MTGRRSRRFPVGGQIPDGALAYTSRRPVQPLSEVERALLISVTGGVTGWNFGITHHPGYAPSFPNYSGSATGRTFPSAAGFHTSQLFFTDETGTYLLPSRDEQPREFDSIEAWISHTAESFVRISDTRLELPREEPYMEGHNTWIGNHPGSLLAFPVADLAEHLMENLWFFAANGYPIIDDINGRKIPAWNGFHRFHTPMTHFRCRSSSSTRSPRPAPNSRSPPTTGCWHCRRWVSAAGPTTDWTGCPCWAAPVIRGLPVWGSSPTTTTAGLSRTSPGCRDISRRSARRMCRRSRPEWRNWSRENSAPGGPFHPDTPGPWSDTAKVRGSALPAEGIQELVTAEASYIYDTFGKLPGTVPTVHVLMYLQAQHLDTDFYDELFGPGAYLGTHADHQARWH